MNLKHFIFPFIINTTLILFALFTYKTYGISWDEPHQRNIGIYASNFVIHQDPAYFSYHDRHYGAWYEIILITFERLFKITDNLPQIYQMRHLINFFTYIIGVNLFYLISKFTFKNKTSQIILTLMFILHPRILSHAFYNTKDIPFLTLSLLCTLTLLINLKKPFFMKKYKQKSKKFNKETMKQTKKKSLWSSWTTWASWNLKNTTNSSHLLLTIHALSLALLITHRIIGLYFLPISIIMLMFSSKNKPRHVPTIITSFILYTCFFILISWPLLWQNPIQNFTDAINRMSHFPWNSQINYLTQAFPANKLPWHYLFTWIFISTPLIYIILFLIGIILIIKQTQLILKNIHAVKINAEAKQSKFFIQNTQYPIPNTMTISLLSIIIPFSAIFILNSTYYDAWRQLFFIYPSILFIAGIAIDHLISNHQSYVRPIRSSLSQITITLIAISFFFTSFHIYKTFPNYHIYFNPLAKQIIQKNNLKFDLDYWGISYRQGLEYIAQMDNSMNTPIKITFANFAGDMNLYTSSPKLQSKFKIKEDIDKSDYYITNYRIDKYNYQNMKPYHQIKVDNLPILGIYKISHPIPSTPNPKMFNNQQRPETNIPND